MHEFVYNLYGVGLGMGFFSFVVFFINHYKKNLFEHYFNVYVHIWEMSLLSVHLSWLKPDCLP